MERMNYSKKLIMLGVLDSNGYELDNRVYFRGGICPCISTITAQKMCVKKYERDNNKRCNRQHEDSEQR